jgi:hypothetical protein
MLKQDIKTPDNKPKGMLGGSVYKVGGRARHVQTLKHKNAIKVVFGNETILEGVVNVEEDDSEQIIMRDELELASEVETEDATEEVATEDDAEKEPEGDAAATARVYIRTSQILKAGVYIIGLTYDVEEAIERYAANYPDPNCIYVRSPCPPKAAKRINEVFKHRQLFKGRDLYELGDDLEEARAIIETWSNLYRKMNL